ncbi:F-box protein PP2-A13-like [Zingiber officinale]|uniref:F-box protein PP2-A13-like n=1 Tax=Zingiber officinale TaxID=94328 RepID=UPI001C4DD8E2|nr:F-box protein PP2-A13-like [Zingiber officinale]
MGAAGSSAAGSEGGSGRTGLGDLPEGCVAEIMLRLDPTQICRLARLSRVFRRAASADLVWETKLPRNYRYLLRRALGEESSGGREFGKKEIFALLCRRNAFDGEHTEFYLDKNGGLICIEISSKALTITGIGDRRYWAFIPTAESKFRTVAYLHQTWWLEVRGEQEFCFPEGTYSLYFRLRLGKANLRLGRRVYSPEHIRGWDLKPVRFQLSTSNGQFAQTKCYLDDPGIWIDYHVGDFVVGNSDAPITVEFSMIQIDCTHMKRGLCVDLVSIRPKDFNSVPCPL